jgi:hypothetical protein
LISDCLIHHQANPKSHRILTTPMNHDTLASDHYKELCEAIGCFAKAENEVSVPVGELGVIILLVCDNCMRKFRDHEFALKKKSVNL